MTPTICPLSLSPLTRDLWGQYDATVIAQLAGYYADPCYTIKFYKAPSDDDELLGAGAFVSYGMKVTPGSLIFGFYLPCVPVYADLQTSAPPPFTVQITDASLKLRWFDDPVASLFLGNFKPCYESTALSPVGNTTNANTGSFPNLLNAPWPVVGKGLFMVEIQSTDTVQQRIELVFGVLEVCG